MRKGKHTHIEKEDHLRLSEAPVETQLERFKKRDAEFAWINLEHVIANEEKDAAPLSQTPEKSGTPPNPPGQAPCLKRRAIKRHAT